MWPEAELGRARPKAELSGGAADGADYWQVKSDIEIVLDAAIYRCVTNLVMWGRTGYARYRMIAVFYGAWYMHEVRGLRGGLTHGFVQWHIHVFRDFYMTAYPEPGTWFGMTQQVASGLFDTTHLDGLLWVSTVGGILDAAADAAVQYMGEHLDAAAVERFQRCMNAAVSNERTLFAFACKGLRDVQAGVEAVFAYHAYHVDDPRCVLLQRRVLAAIAAVASVLRRERSGRKRWVKAADGGDDDAVRQALRHLSRGG